MTSYGSPKVKNNVVIKITEKGGLKVPHVESAVMAQKAIWVKHFLKNTDACWLQLLKSHLPGMTLCDLLKCSTDADEIAPEIPTFYRQILQSWYCLKKDPTKNTEFAREIMWFNKFIKIDHKYIFNRELYNKGLVNIGDFMHEDGHFLTHEEFTAKYHVTITKMYLMSLMDAIPFRWRLALKNNFITTNQEELPFVKLHGDDKMITNLQSCDLYTEFL